MNYYLAIDIGASSGRHIVGWLENGEIKSKEIHRFPNGVKNQNGHLVWDTESLFHNVVEGIKLATQKFKKLKSLAITTWGVDYVLLKEDEKVFPCFSYRDNRTKKAITKVHEKIPFEKLYGRTGIQFQPFNTIYQLYDDLKKGRLSGVTDFLMIPEYLNFLLTGVKMKEYTNATTTGLVSVERKEFDLEIIQKLDFPQNLFKKLHSPGERVGNLKDELASQVGGQVEVVLCASHDTASAVEGIQMNDNSPYISSGTWSLLGLKTKKPHTDENSRKGNWSNEGGVGYIRYQKNIMGLWIVQSLQKELCPEKDFAKIANEARTSTFSGVIDVNNDAFLSPTSMKKAFDTWFNDSSENPQKEDDYFRCGFVSLAKSYKKALSELEDNCQEKFHTLYIVGGGAKNTFLNELTQDECNLKVKALPIEGTAIGNLKLQIKRHKAND